MGKRKRVRRSSVHSKHQKDNHSEDQISQLPDAILVHILSLLTTTTEAVRSSVLSHRWRDLWKLTTCLNFDWSGTLLRLKRSGHQSLWEFMDPEMANYVTWVNHILKVHQSPVLDEFRVNFFQLDASSSRDIYECIKLMIPKRVKRLEMNVLPLISTNGCTFSEECYLFFKSPSNLSSIKSLTSLSLKNVNVQGELLEYFICNCPQLELLCVSDSDNIVQLKVAGPSLQLKHLEIVQCNRLESLEVCALKLVTLKYMGKIIRMHILNIPLLAELKIRVEDGLKVACALVPFSSLLSLIQTLELGINLENDKVPQVSKLTNLKHLILKVHPYGTSLLDLIALIEAAPLLHKFTLQLSRFNSAEVVQVPKIRVRPHQCLKDVEISGFIGSTEFELALYLVQSAINLEKIVVRHSLISEMTGNLRDQRNAKRSLTNAARKLAFQLEEKLPPRAKLVFLRNIQCCLI